MHENSNSTLHSPRNSWNDELGMETISQLNTLIVGVEVGAGVVRLRGPVR